jgi:predicted metal-binding membrane protein
MRAASRGNLFLPLIGGLAALSWATLWVWGQSPYARYLDHGSWREIGFAGRICHALPGGEATVGAFFLVGGWVLMLTAMMLPTTLPLLDTFRRLTARRADRRQLTALVLTGYFAVWLSFGAVAHIADWALLVVAQQSSWVAANSWAVAAAVLAIAGLYQFSALKYRCLDKCRSPFGFVIEHWRGRREKWQSLLLGIRHGAFCVGCCWCLMLLMFVVGVGNIGWMLALGAVMAAEKNLPGGRRLAAPVGAVLLLAALWVGLAGAVA